jgi:pimeloyl-ACP methyl ester carboxylesterase
MRAAPSAPTAASAAAAARAAAHPDQVDRLALMAAVGTAPAQWQVAIPVGILKIAQWLAEGTREQLIREFAELQVYDSSVLTEELLRERTVAASDPEIVATNAATNMLPGDLNPDMPKITAPTLLLWGREDNFIPLEWALNALRSIPNAELRVIPFCGHWMQFERQDFFNAAVREHLQRPALVS